MGLFALLRWLRYWFWCLGDAFPPYRKVEGLIENKEADPGGKFYIRLGSARVEVDSETFDTLVVGESLRVRYTRGNRAVNVDRLLTGRGPG